MLSAPSVLVDTAARLTCRVKPVPTTSLWPGAVNFKALLLMQGGFRVSGMTTDDTDLNDMNRHQITSTDPHDNRNIQKSLEQD